MLNVLELFSGTHSVGKCCQSLGWNVVSLDLELPADHQIDIMNFDYKQYPQDHFSICWSSPPCTFYSNLQNCWIGRKRNDGVVVSKEWIEEQRKESDKLIRKTLEIFDYFNPELWFMENPQRGQLKNREVVKGLNYYDVSYCMYSDWGYEKRTRIWTNKKGWNNLICDRTGSCGNMMAAQHQKVLGNGYEMIDGKQVLCNTKETRNKLRKHKKDISIDFGGGGGKLNKHKKVCDGGYDKRRKHKLKVSDVHSESTMKQHKKIAVGGSSKIGGEWVMKGTNRLDRYRIPPDLIYSLFLE